MSETAKEVALVFTLGLWAGWRLAFWYLKDTAKLLREAAAAQAGRRVKVSPAMLRDVIRYTLEGGAR